MSPRVAVTVGVVLLLGAGCRQRAELSREAQAREAQVLLDTDRAWAEVTSAGKNPDSILAYWTEDARVVSPGQVTLEGKRAIRQMVTSSLSAPGFHITWTPEAAVVSRSGDIGYTYGANEFTIPGPTGQPSKMVGRYLAVWRKQPDGRWRRAVEYTTPEPTRPVQPAAGSP